ncbi:hypothetical protein Noda2021_10430 [Candidatus Dependentiae bacterium Noda2021]|nr:hypothetical protein Noda2021_10430 [Candidatus Dependentiae bacterium Noda2021]
MQLYLKIFILFLCAPVSMALPIIRITQVVNNFAEPLVLQQVITGAQSPKLSLEPNTAFASPPSQPFAINLVKNTKENNVWGTLIDIQKSGKKIGYILIRRSIQNNVVSIQFRLMDDRFTNVTEWDQKFNDQGKESYGVTLILRPGPSGDLKNSDSELDVLGVVE